ncbi:hypothetical protein K432DRAFT_349238 [Lepidopterella palustris CBS 459.81]|uniref:Peroxin 11C n=1 Tax=Lepidopterella palustris CBS 459.81 TaxID=1314670 RepID=A0A8E2EEZ9_9PEZI|nr:hypothetical protein K432DRAFT_349238 [Lepidopterella palustris CBS 459.81]
MDSSPSQPTTTTIPTSTPTQPSITPPISASEPTPSPPTSTHSRIRQIRLLILQSFYATAHRSDSTILHLSRLLSTPSGTDSLLCTVGYTLTFLHSILSRLLTNRLSKLATDIAAKASDALLPGETLITTFPAPGPTAAIARVTASSKALADVISDFRIFVRLWGLVGIYEWGRGTWKTGLNEGAGRKERILRAVTWGQIVACAAYQILENGAYLASKGVLSTAGWMGEAGAKRQARWWVWSSRFWAAHVGLEGVRLGAVWWYRGKEDKERAARGAVGDGEKEEKLLIEQRKKEDRLWWRDAISNSAYAPLTVHWSLEEGLVSDAWVGFLGAVAGAVSLREALRNTA